MRHTPTRLFMPFVGPHRFQMPADAVTDKETVRKTQFYPKTRAQWDYQGIDEKITEASEFVNYRGRDEYINGPRMDNSGQGEYTQQPHHKQLHEYFDDYTKPGRNAKVEGIRAAQEHWDTKSFYYPGEASVRNRPAFRSVPAELLNTRTRYHWSETITKQEEISSEERTRSWNPTWPPPGYKKPKLWTKREFVFGVEEPGLLSEIERWYWFKMWFESNVRNGVYEIGPWMFLAWLLWYTAKTSQSNMKMQTMFANMNYPGRQYIRSFGEPNDWEKEVWWWQRPLDEFPNQGEVWYHERIRHGYINHIKARDAEEKLAAELAAEQLA
jgi:hypothetical protein